LREPRRTLTLTVTADEVRSTRPHDGVLAGRDAWPYVGV
jgi:hypothetical protein